LLVAMSRAQQLALTQGSTDAAMGPTDGTGGSASKSNRNSSFFKKKTAWRAKSLGKDHWDDAIFGRLVVMGFL